MALVLEPLDNILPLLKKKQSYQVSIGRHGPPKFVETFDIVLSLILGDLLGRSGKELLAPADRLPTFSRFDFGPLALIERTVGTHSIP